MIILQTGKESVPCPSVCLRLVTKEREDCRQPALAPVLFPQKTVEVLNPMQLIARFFKTCYPDC